MTKKGNFSAYQQALKNLNPAQKQAVDSTEGPVMVIAGPGTGKTQTVALRIANILLQNLAKPEEILALTFTESAASEMRTRLTEFIGHTAYYINISTFHSFCAGVIRDNPSYFAINPTSEPLSELQKLRLFQQFLDQGSWRDIRPLNSPYHYLKALMGAVQDLKREGVSPDQFGRILEKESDFLSVSVDELKKSEYARRKRTLAKNIELVEIYRLYEQALEKEKLFDFEDLIAHVVRTLDREEDLLADYSERYQYLLVDEYQDTNSAQDQLISLLSHHWGESANVFVVGDPDQSIMRFQGASTENIEGFVKSYPRATLISLRDNYRSASSILASAHNLISHNELRLGEDKGALRAAWVKKAGKITLVTTSSALSEDLYISEKIQKLLAQGVPAREIAVIYRNNADSASLSATLAKFGIDYVVQGGGDILEDRVVLGLLKIFRVIDEMRRREDDTNLFTILNYEIFHTDPVDVLKLSRHASSNRLTLFDVLADRTLLQQLKLKDLGSIEAVLTQLAGWQSLDANSTFTEFFESVLKESGYLDYVLQSTDVHNHLSRLNTLFSEVKKMNSLDHHLDLHKFLENIDLMQTHKLRIESESFVDRDDAITLTTAHSAKGLEWQHVFIYRSYDGHWGNKRKFELIKLPEEILVNSDLSKKEKNEDERRLFYVALTRAKEHVTLTRAASYEQSGRQREVVPSMFLFELGEGLQEEKLVKSEQEEENKRLADNLRPARTFSLKSGDAEMSGEEEAYLRSLVDKFTLSPTSLNTYLECPYRFKLNNLLKIPRAKPPHMSFGTAIHQALEEFYRTLKDDGRVMSLEKVQEIFIASLSKEIMTKNEFALRGEKGKELLKAYFGLHAGQFTTPLATEKNLSAVLVEPNSSSIRLSGKIDRLEWADVDSSTVRVIDYKTGKKKTKGEIVGTTANSTGALKRQLVFYRLLLDLDPTINYHFGEAELDFVGVPEEEGKFARIRLEVSDEEVRELKETIRQVMADIRALRFGKGVVPHGNCEACALYDHLWGSN